MEAITLEEAIEIRKRLKYQLKNGGCPQEVNVISNILSGEYDRIKNPSQVAKDDLEFTKAYNRGDII